MAARQLPYPVFDADNHFYETEDSLSLDRVDRARIVGCRDDEESPTRSSRAHPPR